MFTNIKTILTIGIIGVIVLLGISTYTFYNKYKNVRELYSIESNNYKAEIASKEGRIIQYKYTIDALRYSKDSVDIKLSKLIDELKIKDKKIKQLQYMKDVVQKTDTIVFTDTIFVNNFIQIDTTLQNKHYRLDLSLRYPSTIIVNPKFTLERSIVFDSKKETIKPPKIWPLRIFQRKHIICDIIVKDNNPYLENIDSKFIEIIN